MKTYKTLNTAISGVKLDGADDYMLSYNTSRYGELSLTKKQLRCLFRANSESMSDQEDSFIILAKAWHLACETDEPVFTTETVVDSAQVDFAHKVLAGAMKSNARNGVGYHLELLFGLISGMLKSYTLIESLYETMDEAVADAVKIAEHYKRTASKWIAHGIWLPTDSFYQELRSVLAQYYRGFDLCNTSCVAMVDMSRHHYSHMLDLCDPQATATAIKLAIFDRLDNRVTEETLEWLSVELHSIYIQRLDLYGFVVGSMVDVPGAIGLLNLIAKYDIHTTFEMCYELITTANEHCKWVVHPDINNALISIVTDALEVVGDIVKVEECMAVLQESVPEDKPKAAMSFNITRPSTVGKSSAQIIVEGMLLSIHGLVHMLSADREWIELTCATEGLPNMFETVINIHVLDILHVDIANQVIHIDELYDKIKSTTSRISAIQEYAKQVMRLSGEDNDLDPNVVAEALCDIRIEGKSDLRVYSDMRYV